MLEHLIRFSKSEKKNNNNSNKHTIAVDFVREHIKNFVLSLRKKSVAPQLMKLFQFHGAHSLCIDFDRLN